MSEAPPLERPGLLTRTRRVRQGVLLLSLAGVLGYTVALEAGWLGLLDSPPLKGTLRLGREDAPVTVAPVTMLSPAAWLVVTKVPRGAGYRLRAAMLEPQHAQLGSLPDMAKSLDALAAVNGDYHRLSGALQGTPFSTLIEDGRAWTVGSPFDYACQLWLDAAGVPHVGQLPLRAELELPGGERLPAFRNIDDPVGIPIVVDRPRPGAWSSEGYRALPIEVLGEEHYRVSGPLGELGGGLTGPAILLVVGSEAERALGALGSGAELRLHLLGDVPALAIGTGPRLLRDSAIAPELERWRQRVARTAIGYDDESFYLVTTVQGPRSGLTLEDFAACLLKLGCREAINLDGGPSTASWTEGRYVNRAPDDPLACGLFVLPTDADSGTPLR